MKETQNILSHLVTTNQAPGALCGILYVLVLSRLFYAIPVSFFIYLSPFIFFVFLSVTVIEFNKNCLFYTCTWMIIMIIILR